MMEKAGIRGFTPFGEHAAGAAPFPFLSHRTQARVMVLETVTHKYRGYGFSDDQIAALLGEKVERVRAVPPDSIPV